MQDMIKRKQGISNFGFFFMNLVAMARDCKIGVQLSGTRVDSTRPVMHVATPIAPAFLLLPMMLLSCTERSEARWGGAKRGGGERVGKTNVIKRNNIMIVVFLPQSSLTSLAHLVHHVNSL